ncbi:MAG: hypothetical protein PHQ27_00910 [Victivallales bacterium]|nr:hypothetical protein [Victivallales bacterium]
MSVPARCPLHRALVFDCNLERTFVDAFINVDRRARHTRKIGVGIFPGKIQSFGFITGIENEVWNSRAGTGSIGIDSLGTVKKCGFDFRHLFIPLIDYGPIWISFINGLLSQN